MAKTRTEQVKAAAKSAARAQIAVRHNTERIARQGADNRRRALWGR